MQDADRAQVAASPVPRLRETYRCDRCRYENIVSAETHRPRMCPLTNCGGTQSPVVLKEKP
jgi:hypothetical protein